MQSILEELWYGNICPNEGCRKTTPEVKELMGYIADHHEALLGMLTDTLIQSALLGVNATKIALISGCCDIA